ncbi:hypothetical protein [Pseudarthrobacter sp. H2]|uniref:hypothetical protein n=1 Tax=Pseudarthrobacter sp. H2 TaxID=3418415 RepID=UPI003CECFE40
MTERPQPTDARDEGSGRKPVRGPEPGTPRWVKAFMIAAVILVLAFAAIHLAGGGMGSHTP